MTILYVSGPMSGLPDYNFPAFDTAARRLRDVGYTVINPAENWGAATHIHQVLLADGIATLQGWGLSLGARLEVDIADNVGIPVEMLEHWLDLVELSTVTA
jgi:hypothetical protein